MRNSSEPRRRGLWVVLLLALVLVPLACWQCAGEDEEPTAAPAEAPVSVAPAPWQMEPQPPPAREPAVVVVDAGAPDAALAFIDDGAPARREPTRLELEAYLRKWREALEPLMARTTPLELKAIVAGAPPAATTDAGSIASVCLGGDHTFTLQHTSIVDHVVVVDTSGSMIPGGLKAASDWIARLEFELAHQEREYRILVLAEPAQLKVGSTSVVARRISSNDGLDVMLASARDERPRWLSMLREGSELRIVLITDDKPQVPDPRHYLDRFAKVFGAPHSYTFSVMGGFTVPPEKPLLLGDDPINSRRCNERNTRIFGMDPGEVYQRIAMEAAGVRASLCSDLSRKALVTAVLPDLKPRSLCAFRLGDDPRVDNVRALGQARTEYLHREPSLAQCEHQRRGYLVEGPLFTLCPETCESLVKERIDEIQLHVDCAG